jgi:hypothetical protein
MRLIRNRPAQPAAPPTNPSTHRAEAQRQAVPEIPTPHPRDSMSPSLVTFTTVPVRNAG